MPYNTRRKSLSLPSLGIHLPVSHASRAAARSPPSTTPTEPPPKKIKRSHGSASPSPMSPPTKREAKTIKYENTPPPSPTAEVDEPEQPEIKREIDLEGINDDIVEGVIIQLQKTANRPHLVKELAAVLSSSVKIVETSVPLENVITSHQALTILTRSANPSAIISSRLSTYLKRPCWTALAPCPIAKELETVHPRRTYFYLTTYPHQPIPDPAQVTTASEALRFPQRTIISPSLSSAASRSDEADTERRRELSPSPEVDLSSPDFDEVEDNDLVAPLTPTGSFSGRPSHQEPLRSSALSRNVQPEKDEKEFEQKVQELQRRQMSQDIDAQMRVSIVQPSSALPEAEYALSKHMDVDGELFGDSGRVHTAGHTVFVSSPAMKPLMVSTVTSKKIFEDTTGLWTRIEDQMEWDTRSPENIELDELDGLLDDF